MLNSSEPDLESLLPLKQAVLHILLALADGEQHGYGIMQSVEAFTKGQVKLGPGTLYRSIKQMLDAGWIEELDERPDPALDDERRRYYRLTGLGQRLLEAELQRMESLLRLARDYGLLTERRA